MASVVQNRLLGIDRLRGVAVVGMMIDHAIIQVNPYSWFRLLLPWHGLPIFCLLVGAFGQRRNLERVSLWLASGIFLSLFVSPTLGTGVPDVLCLLALGRILMWSKWSYVVLILALMQPIALRLPWSGYQPGAIVSLVLLGPVLVDLQKWNAFGLWFPSSFGFLGRKAFPIYIGHLLLILFLVNTHWG